MYGLRTKASLSTTAIRFFRRLHLMGNPLAAKPEGRVLTEALAGGPDEEQVAVEVRTLRVASGAYKAALQVTESFGRRYLDKSWRE